MGVTNVLKIKHLANFPYLYQPLFYFSKTTIDVSPLVKIKDPKCHHFIIISQPAGRGSTAIVVTTAGALRLLPKIERDLGTERARLGTFRGLGTERARLGTFRGFGTERARLGTFKKNLKKLSFFYSKRAETGSKPEV